MNLCDFLSVELAAETVVVTKECNRKTEVKSVERGGYHVVIFCLLLEYLPRYLCTLKISYSECITIPTPVLHCNTKYHKERDT